MEKMKLKKLILSGAAITSIIGIAFIANRIERSDNDRDSRLLRVGKGDWVNIKEESGPFKKGDLCLIQYGGYLEVKEDDVVFKGQDSDLSNNLIYEKDAKDCPEGARIKITHEHAVSLDDAYIKYNEEKKDVTSQIRDMEDNPGVLVDTIIKDVMLANPEVVKNGNRSFGYGNICLITDEVRQKTYEIGKLANGASVMRINYDEKMYDKNCPDGAIFWEMHGGECKNTVKIDQ